MSDYQTYRIPCMIMRGGTSKGLFFLEEDLPKNQDQRDQLLLRIMGSPDQKQIDGLGGATSVTSKVAILKKSEHPAADVDYTFAQVSVDKPFVSYSGNCGNISSAVGAFALEKKLLPIQEGSTCVRIYNVNTDKLIYADLCTENGRVMYTGEYEIAGVPGGAAPVRLSFIKPEGTLGKGLLPTGNVRDILDIPQFGPVEVSIVDAANPLVFVKAGSIGMKGTELLSDLDSEKLNLLEAIRGAAALKLGFISEVSRSAWDSAGVPKMTIVSAAVSHSISNGAVLEESAMDIIGRMMSMQKPHATYAMTGAVCTVAAAAVPGSIVNECLKPGVDLKNMRIAHPGGIMEAGVEYSAGESGVRIDRIWGYRTANLLMEGTCTGFIKYNCKMKGQKE